MGPVLRLETGRVRLFCAGQNLDVRLDSQGATLGDRRVAFCERRTDGELIAITIGGRPVPLRAVREGGTVWIWCQGRAFEVQKAWNLAARPRETGGRLVSPMPGRVRRVDVAAGDRVQRGQVVLILEAMKMEHAIRSPRDGIVTAMTFQEGDLVEAGVELVEIE